MPNRAEYKEALSALDRNTRLCLLYLEKTVDDKFKADLTSRMRRPDSKPDLSKIEVGLDSLQKQSDGLRPKVEEAHELVKEHDGREIYLKKLNKKVEVLLGELRDSYEELYKSGYFSEGQRRKIREQGLIKSKEGGDCSKKI